MISILACRTFTVHGAKAHFLFLPFPNKRLFDTQVLQDSCDHRVYQVLDGLGFVVEGGTGGKNCRSGLGELGHIAQMN